MDDQPWIDSWPMFEEAYSKFPVLAEAAVGKEVSSRPAKRCRD